jgi:hypothetical protein
MADLMRQLHGGAGKSVKSKPAGRPAKKRKK